MLTVMTKIFFDLPIPLVLIPYLPFDFHFEYLIAFSSQERWRWPTSRHHIILVQLADFQVKSIRYQSNRKLSFKKLVGVKHYARV